MGHLHYIIIVDNSITTISQNHKIYNLWKNSAHSTSLFLVVRGHFTIISESVTSVSMVPESTI